MGEPEKFGSIEKASTLIKTAANLPPAFGIAYTASKYPGYISYGAIVFLFMLGVLMLLPLHRWWPKLQEWRWPTRIFGMVCLLAVIGGLGYKLYRVYWGPVIILVDKYTEEEAAIDSLTDEIWESLSTTLKEKPGIKLIRSELSLSGLTDDAVRKEARKRDADIVIWGNRRIHRSFEKLDVHFDVLNPGRRMTDLESARIRVKPREISSDKSYFEIEVDVANDLTFLALMALGLARRAAADSDGAIAAFSEAIENINRQRQILQSNESVINPTSYWRIFFERGMTFLDKRDYESAFSDFIAISDKDKYLGGAAFAIGAVVALTRQDYIYTLNYGMRVIEVFPEPDNYYGYYITGQAWLRLAHESSELEEQIKLIFIGAAAMTKAMDLVSTNPDMQRAIADELAGPYVLFAWLHGLAGRRDESEEAFQKAKELAVMSGNIKTLKVVDSTIRKAREGLKNRGKDLWEPDKATP